MPSRNRNKPTLAERLIQLHRLYYYRFGIDLDKEQSDSIHPDGWTYTDLKNGRSIEDITDEYKRKRGYTDIRPWPVSREIQDHYINQTLSQSRQKESHLL